MKFLWKAVLAGAVFMGLSEAVRDNLCSHGINLGVAQAQPSESPLPYPSGEDAKTFTALPYTGFLHGLHFQNNINLRTRTGSGDSSNGTNITRTPSTKRPRFVYSGESKSLFAQVPVYGRIESRDGVELHSNRVWGKILFSDYDVDGVDVDGTEFQVGVDKRKGHTLLGVSGGYATGDVDGGGASGEVDTWSLGAYFDYDTGNWYANGILSYHWHDIEGRGLLAGVGGTADYDANTIAFSSEAGKRIVRRDWAIEPNLSLWLSRTDTDEFRSGGVTVATEEYDSFKLGVGVRIINVNPRANFRPYLFVGYQREFADDQIDLAGSGPVSFSVSGVKLGKNIFTAKLGASHRVNNRFRISGELGGNWRSNVDGQWISGAVHYSW